MSRRSPAPRPAERGFTLVELAVSTLLLLIVLAVAHGLLVESARILRASALRSLRPDDRLAVRLLRQDVLASAPHSLALGWSSLPLDLRSESGTTRWQRDGELLSRRRFTPLGVDLGVRPMLDEVVVFRWRTLLPGLIEVEIVRRIETGSPELRASTVQWARAGLALEATRIVATSRKGSVW